MFGTKLGYWHQCILCIVILAAMSGCAPAPKEELSTQKQQDRMRIESLLPPKPQGKPVVYQVFTRLFGNTNTTNKPWGTIEDNGVGKFSDFTDTALQGIKALSTTHIWFTGVPHHDVITDYSAYGISHDDPDVVKGRAGSPYAVKDYYSVNPDLADDPAKRLQEFEALISRTHNNGMGVIIDIVPNHVARNYQSLAKPDGISDFGEQDDTTLEYAKNNNFYYVTNQDFEVPLPLDGYTPFMSHLPNGLVMALAKRSLISMIGTKQSRSISGLNPMAVTISCVYLSNIFNWVLNNMWRFGLIKRCLIHGVNFEILHFIG
jgi:hypothetical protein